MISSIVKQADGGSACESVSVFGLTHGGQGETIGNHSIWTNDKLLKNKTRLNKTYCSVHKRLSLSLIQIHTHTWSRSISGLEQHSSSGFRVTLLVSRLCSGCQDAVDCRLMWEPEHVSTPHMHTHTHTPPHAPTARYEMPSVKLNLLHSYTHSWITLAYCF